MDDFFNINIPLNSALTRLLCNRRRTRKGQQTCEGMPGESLTPPRLQAIRSQQEKNNSDEK